MSFSPYGAHTEPIFKKYGILKLKDQITLFNGLFVHNHSRELLPSSFNNFFTPCSDLYDTETRRREVAFLHDESLLKPMVVNL